MPWGLNVRPPPPDPFFFFFFFFSRERQNSRWDPPKWMEWGPPKGFSFLGKHGPDLLKPDGFLFPAPARDRFWVAIRYFCWGLTPFGFLPVTSRNYCQRLKCPSLGKFSPLCVTKLFFACACEARNLLKSARCEPLFLLPAFCLSSRFPSSYVKVDKGSLL